MPKNRPQTRGERNHNPGNIEHDPATKWNGLDDPPSDGRFCRFRRPKWGIRALARVLMTYGDRHDIRTPRQIIERWAPHQDRAPDGSTAPQPTEAYIRHVCQRTGFAEDQVLDLQSYDHQRPLVEAIIAHENGRVIYDPEIIDNGLELAGIEVPRRGALKSPEGKAGATVAAGAGSAVLIETARDFAPALSGLAETAPMILAGVLVVAALVFFLDRWRRNSRGVS